MQEVVDLKVTAKAASLILEEANNFSRNSEFDIGYNRGFLHGAQFALKSIEVLKAQGLIDVK